MIVDYANVFASLEKARHLTDSIPAGPEPCAITEESVMSVTVRKFRTGGWEADIRVTLPNGAEHRQRRKAPVSSKSGAQRWGEDRERVWYAELMNPEPPPEQREVPTVQEFWPRFLEGHARANREKPSGIAAKEMIARCSHLAMRGGRPPERFRSWRVTPICERRSGTCTSVRPPSTRQFVYWILHQSSGFFGDILETRGGRRESRMGGIT